MFTQGGAPSHPRPMLAAITTRQPTLRYFQYCARRDLIDNRINLVLSMHILLLIDVYIKDILVLVL